MATSKHKTISGPYQSYQIRVSVSTIAELQTMQPPGVDGAPTFFRDNGLPWFWFSQLPAGYTSSADGHTGATFGKSGFYVSLFALTAAAALGAFLTVARASASRMLDVPTSTLYLVKDGARTYVQSFVSGWHWEANFPAATATDNEVTCRPTAWAALGLNGAFVRDLQGDRTALGQGAWFVNSTAADNEGTGLVGDPLRNDVEIQRRWGISTRARLTTVTTVTYAQAPTTTTNFCCELLNGAQLILVGTPTVTKPGTVLTAVQVQVRTPGAEAGWAITAAGLGAADVGKLAVITNSAIGANIGAYAAVLKDETGGKVRVSPFGKFAFTTLPFTQVTPTIGDTIEIRDNHYLTVGTIDVRAATDTVLSGTTIITCFCARALKLTGNTSQFTGAIEGYRVPLLYDSCQYDGILLGGAFSQSAVGQHRLCGGHGGGTATNSVLVRGPSTATLSQVGFTVAPLVSPGANLSISVDCYFQNCGVTALRITSLSSSGAAFFDRSVANGAISIVGGVYTQTGAVPDWGTANAGHGVTISSTAMYSYATKPTVNSGLGAGREAQIGGTDKLYAAVPFIEPANNAGLVLTA